MIISEETGDAWSVKYRGLVGTSYEDVPVLEQNAPLWLLDFLLGNRTVQKEPVKVVSGSRCILVYASTEALNSTLAPCRSLSSCKLGRATSRALSPKCQTRKFSPRSCFHPAHEDSLTFFLLPLSPRSNARLTANRSLRVRKVCSYVADKLNLRAMSRAPSIADGLNTYGTSPTRPPPALLPPAAGGGGGEYNPETGIEILVNGEVLPNNVTIGTVRHCMWKSGGDVVFTYRLKEPRLSRVDL